MCDGSHLAGGSTVAAVMMDSAREEQGCWECCTTSRESQSGRELQCSCARSDAIQRTQADGQRFELVVPVELRQAAQSHTAPDHSLAGSNPMTRQFALANAMGHWSRPSRAVEPKAPTHLYRGIAGSVPKGSDKNATCVS